MTCKRIVLFTFCHGKITSFDSFLAKYYFRVVSLIVTEERLNEMKILFHLQRDLFQLQTILVNLSVKFDPPAETYHTHIFHELIMSQVTSKIA